jgi:hypothetical protein
MPLSNSTVPALWKFREEVSRTVHRAMQSELAKSLFRTEQTFVQPLQRK